MSTEKTCEHLSLPEVNLNIEPRKKADSCEECDTEGTTWVALRLCLTCGHVGCCDSSVGTHARKHYNDNKHPLIMALPAKQWKWCYVEADYV